MKCNNSPMSLTYLILFQRLLKIPLINSKEELKLKWKKYCVLFAARNDNLNNNDNDNNDIDIISTIKNITLYAPVVTLSSRDIRKLSKPLSKGFERSVHWNEYKTKSENKKTTIQFRYFVKSNFV